MTTRSALARYASNNALLSTVRNLYAPPSLHCVSLFQPHQTPSLVNPPHLDCCSSSSPNPITCTTPRPFLHTQTQPTAPSPPQPRPPSLTTVSNHGHRHQHPLTTRPSHANHDDPLSVPNISIMVQLCFYFFILFFLFLPFSC